MNVTQKTIPSLGAYSELVREARNHCTMSKYLSKLECDRDRNDLALCAESMRTERPEMLRSLLRDATPYVRQIVLSHVHPDYFEALGFKPNDHTQSCLDFSVNHPTGEAIRNIDVYVRMSTGYTQTVDERAMPVIPALKPSKDQYPGKPEIIVTTLSSGDVALFVNGDVIYSRHAGESGPRPSSVGKALAKTLGVEVRFAQAEKPTSDEWSWNDVYASLQVERAAEDASLGCIEASAKSDDGVVEVKFNAAKWFLDAPVEQILILADTADGRAIEWGGCEIADRIAEPGMNPATSALNDYLCSPRNRDNGNMGFECYVNRNSVMTWLHEHRPGVWAQVRCAEEEITLSQSDESEVKGMWDWKTADGMFGVQSVQSFFSIEEAAQGAVKALGLDDVAKPTANSLAAAPR